jgi:hypothetical protein
MLALRIARDREQLRSSAFGDLSPRVMKISTFGLAPLGRSNRQRRARPMARS